MVKNLEDLLNWTEYSNATQKNLQIAKNGNMDAMGLFMTKKFNPNEMISIFQSLADPKYMGNTYSKRLWEIRSKSNERVRGIVDNIEPYKNNSYSSHIAISLPSCLGEIQFPLVTNFAQNTIYNANEYSCPRYEKLVKIYSEKLNTKFNFEHISTNGKYSEKTTIGYNIFEKLSYGANYKLNEYDKIVVISSIVASELYSDFKAANPEKYSAALEGLSEKELSNVDNLTKDILTLAVLRTTDLGNSEISYKIDEALKLQISNDLALISSAGKDITKSVATIVDESVKGIPEKLGFPLGRVVENMQNMGYKYVKSPRNINQALFTGCNLEKTLGIELGIKKAPKILQALTGAALQGGITKIRLILPGLIDSYILTEKQREELTGSKDLFISPSKSLGSVLEKKNKGHLLVAVLQKYEEQKEEIINDVIEVFKEQREEYLGKSYKNILKDVLNEKYSAEGKTSSSSALVRKMVRNNIKEANTEAREAKRQQKQQRQQNQDVEQ